MQEAELQTFRSTLGERHPSTLLAKNNLGVTLRCNGCLLLARELLESALRDGRHLFGKKHHNTLTLMGNLALTLFEAGDLARALKLQKKILKWSCQILGEEHPNTLAAMVNLSTTLCALEDESGARELDEKVLKVHQRNLGGDHPATLAATSSLATTINNQAVALRNTGHLEDAEPLQFEAMKLMVKACGEDSLNAACTYSAAGALYRLQGDLENANIYFCKALAIRTRELGPNADLTQLVRTRLHEMLH
jgi:tetratricopeptide (TPR) repeat protein